MLVNVRLVVALAVAVARTDGASTALSEAADEVTRSRSRKKQIAVQAWCAGVVYSVLLKGHDGRMFACCWSAPR